MNTKILEYIIAIAETGSVTKAAERFYLSRPALAKHLKRIEEEVGTPLFYRNDKKLELTSAGIIYINNATAILQIEKRLESDLGQLKAQKNESITICVDSSLVNFMVRRVLPKFREKYPDCSLVVRHSNANEAIRDLNNGSAQFGIINSKTGSIPGLSTFVVEEDELCMVFPEDSAAGASFLAGDYDSAAYQDLMLALHPSDRTWSVFENDCLSVLKSRPRTTVEVHLFSQTLEYVLNGTSMGFIPWMRLKRDPHTGYVIGHMDPPYFFRMVLAFPADKMLSKEEQYLMNSILDEYEHLEEYLSAVALKSKLPVPLQAAIQNSYGS